MKLKYNRNIELEVVGIGTFKPGQCVLIENDNQAAKYLKSGYFDLVKEKKKKIRVKKSKKKGVDK